MSFEVCLLSQYWNATCSFRIEPQVAHDIPRRGAFGMKEILLLNTKVQTNKFVCLAEIARSYFRVLNKLFHS